MRIPDFALERYLARWEFTAPYLLSSSDVEGLRMGELLALADPETRGLWDNLTLGYTQTLGHPLLRQAIADLYTGVLPDEIMVFSGAEEAIFTFMNAALAPGDHAIVTWPGYQSLYEVARGVGADVTLLPLEREANWSIDLDAFRRALRPTTRLLVINYPHNPTGALLDPETFEGILKIAEEAGAYVLSDEVYRMLELQPELRLPAAVERSRNGVSLGVMSKAFGLAGLRIGWIAGHAPDVLSRCAAFKDYLTICPSAPSEILALIGLRARKQLLARAHDIIARNLVLLDQFFNEWWDVFDWVRPRAGSTGFPRFRSDIPVDEFARELVQQEGVLLLPGSVYRFPGNHFRLGFGRANLPEALRHFERFISQRFGDRAHG